MKHILLLLGFVFWLQPLQAQQHVLVLYEGRNTTDNLGRGDAVQIAQLLGHFRTLVDIRSVEEYTSGQMEAYDAVFFIGYTLKCSPPPVFMHDMLARKNTAVWLHTGMLAYDSAYVLSERYGFDAVKIDTVKGWTRVLRGADEFTKTEPNITLCRVTDPSRCTTVAVARSVTKGETPYVLRSGRFWYVADSPFASADERDRYLLFADILHDILGERHAHSHRAMIRIEDVHPLEDPDRLRRIADILYNEDVPFLVGLIPFYVDPEQGIRVSLTDKPELVDAIHYMVEKGATVVMHGVTHQYKGLTAADYEFWDIAAQGPIEDETMEYVRSKVQRGLEECIRNGIYPVIWETPHYTGTDITYDALSTIFSSAMEQRAIINTNNTQYFPYIIEHDQHGQKIYPENLGYVPLDERNPDVARNQVEEMIGYARVNLGVRDGFAAGFIHAFVPQENLLRLIEGIRELGYTFIDLRKENNIVQLRDKAIVTGRGEVTLELQDQYLREYWFNDAGELERTQVSAQRRTGVVKYTVTLKPGQLYFATPTEIRSSDRGFVEGVLQDIRSWYNGLFGEEKRREEMRVAVLWDSLATGGGMMDQVSFINTFRSVGVHPDTLFLDQRFNGSRYNLLIVPYAAVERLRNPQFSALVEWVRSGGKVITDGRNEFALELGLTYSGSSVGISGVRERLYPEENVVWQRPAALEKFEVESDDVVLAADREFEAPVVIGRAFGSGSVMYIGTRFDPYTDGGFSRYPYFLHYVASFLDLHPVFRRDALELYFDPGFRSAITIEFLVRRWVTNGVRAVYVGSWHEYPTYTYDYERLIRLCHENGILVYAWLEPPQVSHKFWVEHPEWREKNVYGKDNRASWRYPLAMTDTAAVSAMLRNYRRFLLQYDFDGVNIAETYFESDVRGPAEPGSFAPMHPSARSEFSRRNGFDPITLFDQNSPRYWKTNPAAWKRFEDYRVDKVVEMHRSLLQLAYEIRKGRPGFAVVVTMLDNLGTPDLRRSQGIDIERILDLRKEYPFQLAVEDPMARWSEMPARYRTIAARYRELLGDDFSLDVNILSFRTKEKPTMFPTLAQSGTEAFALYQVSSSEVRRTLVYSESSINPQDLSWLSFASTGQARITREGKYYRVQSPVSLTLHLSAQQKFVLVDGAVRTSAGDGRFLIPAGSHTVKLEAEGEALFDANTLHASLLSCTGNVLAIEEGERSVAFTYESVERCYITINKKPIDVYVDGKRVDAVVREGVERYSVALPHGHHSVRLVTQGTVSYSIDLTSLLSSTFIVLFGVTALLILIAMYIIVRIRRRTDPAPAVPPQPARMK